jgi:hypothetical protein
MLLIEFCQGCGGAVVFSENPKTLRKTGQVFPAFISTLTNCQAHIMHYFKNNN